MMQQDGCVEYPAWDHIEEGPRFADAGTMFRIQALGILQQQQRQPEEPLSFHKPRTTSQQKQQQQQQQQENGARNNTEDEHCTETEILRQRWKELPSKMQEVLRLASFLAAGTNEYRFHELVLELIIDNVDLHRALELAHEMGWIRRSSCGEETEESSVQDEASPKDGWWSLAEDRIPPLPALNNSTCCLGKVMTKPPNPLAPLFQQQLPQQTDGQEKAQEHQDEARQHLDIGRALWAPLLDEELSTQILSPKLVAQQLIWGSQLIENREERYAVASLLLSTGQSALEQTSDFDAAYYWFHQGIQLLRDANDHGGNVQRHGPRRHWRDEYDLSLVLHNDAAEAAYCCGDFTTMEHLCQQVSEYHRDPLDKLRTSTLRVYKLGTQNDLKAAIKQGLAIVTELKVGFPPRGGVLSVPFKLAWIKKRLGRMEDDEILNMKPLTDERILGAFRIMVILLEYALHAKPLLVPQIAFWMVEVILLQGMSVMSSDAMAALGLLCCHHFNEFELGQRAARLSLAILHMHESEDYMARCATPLYMFCFAYTTPLKELLNPMSEASQIGIRRGDLECAMLCASLHVTASLIASVPLSEALASADVALAQMKTFKQDRMISFTQGSAQLIHNLLGHSTDPVILKGKYLDWDKCVEECTQNGNLSAVGGFHQARIGIEVLLEEFEKAEITSSLLRKFKDLDSLPPFLVAGQYRDEAMAALALCRRGRRNDGMIKRRRRLRLARRKISGLARLCRHSDFFLPHLYMVQGELCAVLGKTVESIEKFKEAIQLAQQHACHMDTGFAQARLAVTLYDAGRTEEATMYMKQASATYSSWGAVALVAKMEENVRSMEEDKGNTQQHD